MVRHIEDTNYQRRLCGVGFWTPMWRKSRDAFHFVLVQHTQSRLFHMKLVSSEIFT